MSYNIYCRQILDPDDKFVAAKAGDSIALPKAVKEHLGHRKKDVIAGLMSVSVIDALKIINVQEKTGMALLLPFLFQMAFNNGMCNVLIRCVSGSRWLASICFSKRLIIARIVAKITP